MGTLLTLLAYVVLSALGLLLLVLGAVVLVPTHLVAAGRIDDDTVDGALHGHWGFGLIGVSWTAHGGLTVRVLGLRVRRFRPGISAREESAESERRPRRRERRRSGGRRRGTAREWLGWVRRHRGTMSRIAGRFVGTLRLRLVLRGRLGLSDPADTAALAGVLRGLHLLSPQVRVDVAPDYLDEALDLDGRFSLRIWPIHWVGVAVLALLSPRTWRLMLSVPRTQ